MQITVACTASFILTERTHQRALAHAAKPAATIHPRVTDAGLEVANLPGAAFLS